MCGRRLGRWEARLTCLERAPTSKPRPIASTSRVDDDSAAGISLGTRSQAVPPHEPSVPPAISERTATATASSSGYCERQIQTKACTCPVDATAVETDETWSFQCSSFCPPVRTSLMFTCYVDCRQ